MAVCEYIIKSLCADESTWRELLELPSYCLELILRPPVICPQSSAKLITYIEKRAQDEKPFLQDLPPSETQQRIGSRRAALLSKCPESNLRSLASLAATLPRSDRVKFSGNDKTEYAHSAARDLTSHTVDGRILDFGKQFHALNSADLKKEPNGFNETALSAKPEGNETTACEGLNIRGGIEERRWNARPNLSNYCQGSWRDSGIPSPPLDISTKEFGNGMSLMKKRKLAVIDTVDKGSIESSSM